MMSYAVRIERVSSQHLAVVRRLASPTELPRVIPQACGLVWNVVKAAQIKGGRHVAIYRAAGDGLLNIEVGVEVASAFPGSGDVVASTTPAGDAATTTHFGPYQKLGEANEAITQWCPAQGRALAGVSWEIYGHWQDAWNEDPSKIRTDVFYLLKS